MIFRGNFNGLHAAILDPVADDFPVARLDQDTAGAVIAEFTVSDTEATAAFAQ